jgi:hypothetical protein
MPFESPIPAESVSPPAGACRGAGQARAPPPSAPDFDAATCGREPRLPRRRIGPRWMFVGPYAVPAPPHLFVRTIQQAVEVHFGLPAGSLRSPRRDREVAMPRQLAMYLCRRLAGRTLPEIGRMFGDRHHTTVIHAVRAIEARRRSDREIDCDLRFLVDALTRPEPQG